MSEPQTPVNATPAAPAAPATPAPAGPSAAETSMAKIRALQPLSDESGEQPEATPEPAQPKPGKKVVNPKGDKHEQLKNLAKELGLELEEGRLLPSEVAKFREWKRKQTQAFETDVQKRMNEVIEREKSHAARVEKAEALEKAMEGGDYEGIAKLLGHEDWNKLQESVIARISDPNYKKMRELERWKEDQEKQRVESEKQQETQRKAERRAKETQEYLQGLSQTMSKSKDPLLAALHDEPLLMHSIYRIQGENYDGQSVPPPEKVLRMSAKGGARTVYDELHSLYTKMHSVFGKPEAAAPAPAAPAKKPAPKSAPVPPSAGVDASGPGKWGQRPKKDWFEYQRAKLAEAIEADKRTGQ